MSQSNYTKNSGGSLQHYSRYTQKECKSIFDKQYDLLTSGPSQNVLQPMILYGNTALASQDPYNPITYYLYRQP
jgi:hypothetical protein